MTLDMTLEADHLFAMGNMSTEAPLLHMDFNSTTMTLRIVQAINLYLIPVICGVGLLGGLCSCLVFTFTTFQYQPCSQYLAVLTASDSGFLTALLLGWLTTIHHNLATHTGYCQVMVYMTYTCSFLSAWYLVLLMVERYITVCHPLHAPVLCTKRNARVAIIVTTVIALLLYSHSFFTTDWALNSVESPCIQKERHLPFLAIFTYVDFLLSFFLPFSIIFSLNLRIILAVRSFRRRHRPLRPNPALDGESDADDAIIGASGGGGGLGDSSGRSSGGGGGRSRGMQYCLMSHAQVRATKLLVWVASVFLVLYLPSHALRMYVLIRVASSSPDGRVYSADLILAQQLLQFIYYINFAVDFFVFSVTSKSFRRNIARCLKKF